MSRDHVPRCLINLCSGFDFVGGEHPFFLKTHPNETRSKVPSHGADSALRVWVSFCPLRTFKSN